MASPNPKPNHLRALEGNRGKVPHKPQVQPRKNLPQVPKYLNKDAKVLWRTYVKQLHENGILSEVDGHQLADLCVTETRLRSITKEIEATSDQKLLMRLVRLEKDLMQALRIMRGDFGLNPSARTKVQVLDPPEGEGIDKFFT